jgi:lysophospholipase L1-like esterase
VPTQAPARLLVVLLAAGAALSAPARSAGGAQPLTIASAAAPKTFPGLVEHRRPGLVMAAEAASTTPAAAPSIRPLRSGRLAFVSPRAGLAGAPEVATLDVPGAVGHFLVPYIQTGPDLTVTLQTDRPDSAIQIVLDEGTAGAREVWVDGSSPTTVFQGIGYGEHSLMARLFFPVEGTPEQVARGWVPAATAALLQVARGSIVAALGDSTTEGLGDGPFDSPQRGALVATGDWLQAGAVNANAGTNWVTADGRNYPQPDTVFRGRANPSFAIDLARTLESELGHPVLVLNEGWSGITAEGYTHVVTSNELTTLFAATHPDIWLINLGVNDALVGRPGGELGGMLTSVVWSLETRYGAPASAIHLACPSWAKQVRRHNLEASYLPIINQLRAAAGLGAGPNFFAYYRDHPDSIEDQVHPNGVGYNAMATMWAQAVTGLNSAC